MNRVEKFSIDSLRKSVTTYIIITMIIFTTIAVATTILFQENKLNHKETIYHEQIHKNIRFITKHYENSYLNLLERLVNLGHIEVAMKNKDRKKLYELLQHKWDILQRQDKNLKILHLHLKDGTSFLRMHNPEAFGDQLKNLRPMIKKVHQEQTPLAGYETGKYGTTYRIILPIFDKNKIYIGAIEAGLHPNFILQNAYEINGYDGFLFIEGSVLSEKDRQIFAELGGYHLHSIISPQMKKVLKYLKSDLLKECSRITVENKKFKTHLFTLNNLENKPKVKILLFQDITNNDVSNKHLLFLMFTLMGVILIILMIYISKRIKKYQNSILKIYNRQLAKLKNKDEIMIAQSRHAAMGEMISMIAHQWRQPISVISIEASNILADIELDMFSKEQAQKCAKGVILQTAELSKTIDDFRNFFKPDKKMEEIFVKDILDDSLNVIGKSLENSNIQVIIKSHSNTKIKTYPRELMQVFLNLLKNAKEAIVEKGIQDGKIIVSIEDIKDNIHIQICDNAMGISPEIIKDIFNPYFSTKDEDIGTGLGLYMSKTIIHKHLGGNISAYNKNQGACFKITLTKKNS